MGTWEVHADGRGGRLWTRESHSGSVVSSRGRARLGYRRAAGGRPSALLRQQRLQAVSAPPDSFRHHTVLPQAKTLVGGLQGLQPPQDPVPLWEHFLTLWLPFPGQNADLRRPVQKENVRKWLRTSEVPCVMPN